MSVKTYTARTRSQIQAWLRKHTTEDIKFRAGMLGISRAYGVWEANINVDGILTHVKLTFGDTEVDMWDLTVGEDDAPSFPKSFTIAQHRAALGDVLAARYIPADVPGELVIPVGKDVQDVIAEWRASQPELVTAPSGTVYDVSGDIPRPDEAVEEPAPAAQPASLDALGLTYPNWQTFEQAADADPEYVAAQAEHDAAGPEQATWCAGPSAHLPVDLTEFATCGVCLTRRSVEALTRFGSEHVCQDCSPLDLGRDACKVDPKHTVTHANGTTQVFRSPLTSRGLGESAIGAFRWVAERAAYGTYAPDGSSLGTYATPGEAFAVVRHNDGRYTLAGEARQA